MIVWLVITTSLFTFNLASPFHVYCRDPHEIYGMCGGGCETCSDPFTIDCNGDCQEGCFCEEGYTRNEYGICQECHHQCLPATIVIETKYGKVEGDVIEIPEEHFVATAFKGIPFGKAKRFEKPEPPDSWKTTLNASNFGFRCNQHQAFGISEPLMGNDTSEDCLFLNVFAPYKDPTKRPVMVFIHGGAFAVGSSNEYGQEEIINWIVPKGVVFVTINYRLGPWGFFSTGNKDALGNYGLWDQTLALRWVKENIDRFGGDPMNVTILGESAGGDSVALLALSPYSRDLFHQSIIMSGSSYLPWMSPDTANTIEAGDIVSNALQCGSIKTGDTKRAVDCLKSKSTEELLKALHSYKPFGKFVFEGFVPVFDGDFFPEPVVKLQASAPAKPVISGITAAEIGSFIFGTILEWKINDTESFTIDDFIEKLQYLFPSETYHEKTELVRLLALNFYVDAQGDRRNNSFVLEQYIEIFSDFMFGYPAFKEAMERYQHGSTVWLYLFDFYDNALFPVDFKYKGAFHGSDLAYFFKGIFHPSPFDDNDKKIKDIYTTLWTNFAIYGHPNPEQSPFHKDFSWEPLNEEHPTRYLDITIETQQREIYRRKMVAFWYELLPKVLELKQAGNGNGIRDVYRIEN